MCSIPAHARVSVSVIIEETKNEEIANDWEDVPEISEDEELNKKGIIAPSEDDNK